MKDIEKLKYHINYQFKQKKLLKEALTHRSYAVEKGLKYDNQRLEFLGDAVLEIIITEHLFNKYTTLPEGELTKMRSAIVQGDTLADIARAIKLGDFIFLGKGEQGAKGHSRNSTLADAFEALIGAMYLDGGNEVAKKFILQAIDAHLESPAELLLSLNPKGILQEFCQSKWGSAPFYPLLSVEGPDHDKTYTVAVAVNDNMIAKGIASKRKTAESVAAKAALKVLNKEGEVTSWQLENSN
ncbi:ribonuclease III [Lentisphaerota bacterium WC36G]|nr:ribonuclease III [Lentisphaerae bacterium WC36]